MDIAVGVKARFFHPRTLGVMCWGTVLEVNEGDKRVKVKFEQPWPGTYWTYMDHLPDGQGLDTTADED